MFETLDALVLREVRYKEADRILTVFTSTHGKMTVKARGALRKNSRTGAATQQLTYSDMTMFNNRGKWTVNEAVVREGFAGLREDICAFSLGSYFAECLEALTLEDEPDGAVLQLALNCLYALSHALHAPEKIKAVFELRLMCLLGYEPDTSACAVCGKEAVDEPMLSLDNGAVCCWGCRGKLSGTAVPLCFESLAALRYIISAPPKQLLAFTLSDTAQKRLSTAAERYLLCHSERSFSTLDYWKKVR